MNIDHHIKFVEFCEIREPVRIDKIALFDDRDFTEEEILDIVKKDIYEWYSKLIVINKRNYDIVLRSLKGE